MQWRIILLLTFLAFPSYAQDTGNNSVVGDLNSNVGNNSTVDSNNSSESQTNNYNSGAPGALSNPVPSAIAPTVMGGGGNDSCLIPRSQGFQLSLFGVSTGDMEQDPECNRRKDARLLGAPQTVGGLGLQVSGISVMCSNAEVFKAMALANTPCPIMDVVTGKLLLGREAYMRMRESPEIYVVGYYDDKRFWDTVLMIGRDLPDAPQEEITSSLSDRFRRDSNTSRTNNDRSSISSESD